MTSIVLQFKFWNVQLSVNFKLSLLESHLKQFLSLTATALWVDEYENVNLLPHNFLDQFICV
jgi:hypothetical protein